MADKLNIFEGKEWHPLLQDELIYQAFPSCFLAPHTPVSSRPPLAVAWVSRVWTLQPRVTNHCMSYLRTKPWVPQGPKWEEPRSPHSLCFSITQVPFGSWRRQIFSPQLSLCFQTFSLCSQGFFLVHPGLGGWKLYGNMWHLMGPVSVVPSLNPSRRLVPTNFPPAFTQ